MKLSVKLTGIAAAFAFALTVASPVSAQTVADLQAMIAQLQSQLTALSGTSTTTTSTTTFTYTRDLTLGSTGSDVVALQTFLESKGQLTMPAGVAKGYFGEVTRAALARYQANHMITPAVGYFGPVTRAKVMAEGSITTPGTGTPSTPGTVSGGEASLESFAFDAEDDAEEGEMMHVATIEFDVEDADVQIDRVDLEFIFDGQGTADSDPWDVFETITLMVDGEEVAEEDVNDEDEWLRDDSPFVFRLSGLDMIVEEGETAEIEVYLTAMDNVDGAEEGDAEWIIAVDDEGIRGTDGEGIQNYIGEASDSVAFEVDVLGEGESLEIKTSSNDPDASLLLVDEDEDSEWHEVFIFELEGEENDIELDNLLLTFVTTGANYADVVSDVMLEIDGQEFDDFDLDVTDPDAAELNFDLDGDVTVDADDTVEVIVMVEFKKADVDGDGTADGAYDDAGLETIAVEATSVNGEGLDDVSDTSTITSETHTLALETATISDLESESDQNDAGTIGTFTFTFDVTAEEDDITVDLDDIVEAVVGGAATITTSTIISSDAEVETVGNEYTVLEGDTASFTLTYTINPGAGQGGTYYIDLQTVAGVTVDEIAGPETLVE